MIQKRTLYRILLGALVLQGTLGSAFAASSFDEYIIDSNRSFIRCSIRYTVIGKYVAWFDVFKGSLKFNSQDLKNSSVKLELDASSIKSKHPSLDKIVKSKQLLDVNKFPTMNFQSSKIVREGVGAYRVTGKFTLHGVTKELSFPFHLEGPVGEQKKYIKAKGKWLINRKDFGVVWNKVLDRGGVLVGNHVTLDWQIFAD